MREVGPGRSIWLETPEPRRSILIKPHRASLRRSHTGSSHSPIRGVVPVNYPLTDRRWDHDLDHDRPVDVKFEVKCIGEGRRGRIRVQSEKEIKIIISRVTDSDEFYLRIDAQEPLTLYLPSNFRGAIDVKSCPNRPSFSPGLRNRMRHDGLEHGDVDQVYLINTNRFPNGVDEDEVVIRTEGRITLRMWDMRTDAPENVWWETLRWLFKFVQ